MASKTDKGHKNNLANFQTLLIEVESLGTNYNPSQEMLKLANLKTVLTNSQTAFDAFWNIQPTLLAAKNERLNAFKPLDKIIRKVVNSVKACGVSKETVKNVQTVARELLGARRKGKLTEEQKETLIAEGKKVPQEHEISQKTFDSRIANFDRLISLLSSIPQYAPNEKDIQIASLKSQLEVLKAKNTEAQKAETQEYNARMKRDEALYNDQSGLVSIAGLVKTYGKSVLGASSVQYKRLSKISFTTAR